MQFIHRDLAFDRVINNIQSNLLFWWPETWSWKLQKYLESKIDVFWQLKTLPRHSKTQQKLNENKRKSTKFVVRASGKNAVQRMKFCVKIARKPLRWSQLAHRLENIASHLKVTTTTYFTIKLFQQYFSSSSTKKKSYAFLDSNSERHF